MVMWCGVGEKRRDWDGLVGVGLVVWGECRGEEEWSCRSFGASKISYQSKTIQNGDFEWMKYDRKAFISRFFLVEIGITILSVRCFPCKLFYQK